MIKRTLIAAIAMTLTTGAVHAGENKLTKPEGTGMLTGAAAGAIVGGPVGAFVGLMIGGIVGGSVSDAKDADRRAQAVEDELLETRRELALALRSSNESSEPDTGKVMLAALAESMRADVLFRTNSVTLEAPVQEKLAELGKVLSTHPNLAIELHGFADPRGNALQNLALSLQRADVVREALVAGGATAGQILVSAHGEDLTQALQGDFEAYAWERRVSLVIQPNVSSKVAQSR